MGAMRTLWWVATFLTGVAVTLFGVVGIAVAHLAPAWAVVVYMIAGCVVTAMALEGVRG